jgi:hypothetical protein
VRWGGIGVRRGYDHDHDHDHEGEYESTEVEERGTGHERGEVRVQ